METLVENDAFTLGRLVVGALDNNVYIVTCTATNQTVIIDAAAESDRILAEVQGRDVVGVLTTHGHHDHIGAVADIRRSLGVPVRLHPADARIAGLEPDLPIGDGDRIPVGDLMFTAIHTPGHTPGSICFRFEEHLFTGDTLFPGGPGATRFPYSDFDQIMRSLEERLFTFEDHFSVFPGHGPSTTLGEERPEMEVWRKRRW